MSADMNSDMTSTLNRIASFSSWKSSYPPLKLTRNGFFWTGVDDIVQCHACNIQLSQWEDEHDPLVRHREQSPWCPVVYQLCKAALDKIPSHWSNVMNRLNSFKTVEWDPDLTAQPFELAMAGFYYIGPRDRVRCYACHGTLRRWDKDDVPMIEHRSHFPHCKIIQDIELNDLWENVVDIKVPSQGEDNDEDSNQEKLRPPENANDETMCKLCCSKRIDVVLLNCRHLLSCEECSKKIKKCPICRQSIFATLKVFRP